MRYSSSAKLKLYRPLTGGLCPTADFYSCTAVVDVTSGQTGSTHSCVLRRSTEARESAAWWVLWGAALLLRVVVELNMIMINSVCIVRRSDGSLKHRGWCGLKIDTLWRWNVPTENTICCQFSKQLSKTRLLTLRKSLDIHWAGICSTDWCTAWRNSWYASVNG